MYLATYARTVYYKSIKALDYKKLNPQLLVLTFRVE